MIIKCLAAASLAASLATGGAIATHSVSGGEPPAVTVSAGTTLADLPAAGVDDRAGDDQPEAEAEVEHETTTSTRPPAPPAAAPADPAPVVTETVQSAGDAGTVTLSTAGGRLTVTAVAPNAGWTVDTERSAGREVEVTFRNGTRRIEFKAELADGRVQTRVRDRISEAGDEDQPAVTPPATATEDHVSGHDSAPEVEPAEQDGDHSGSGRDGSSDDGSGRDGGGDHSGHGGDDGRDG